MGDNVDSRLLHLADAFASAAVDPTRWMVALRLLADATGSTRGQLIGIGSDRTMPFNWVEDFSSQAHDQFRDMDGTNPRINPRTAVAAEAPLLAVRSEVDYRQVLPLLDSEICLDFNRDHDIPHGCQATLFLGDDAIVGLAVLRTESDGETSAEQRAIFAAIAPFVRSAVRTQMALEQDAARLVTGALDSVAAAVFVCGRDGHIFSHSAAAGDFLDSGRIAMAGGMLRVPGQAMQDRLARVIARHAGPIPIPLESLVLHDGPEAGPPLILDITTLPRRPWSFGLEPRTLVIVRGASRWHGASSAVLQSLYGLSPAEADVALRLARGQPRESIAEERGARLETIRSQIKAIFAKLGIAREAELVAMLGQLLRG